MCSSEGGKEGGKTEVRLSLWEYFVSWLVFYAIQEPTSSSSSSSSSSLHGRGPPSPFANLNDLSQLSWNAFAGTAEELFTEHHPSLLTIQSSNMSFLLLTYGKCLTLVFHFL